ncbi:hypothetical protein HK405_009532 [Cladochytrium tenue]|nr:hypothetical protein HK405_009532 [Cladochytrium tenue]
MPPPAAGRPTATGAVAVAVAVASLAIGVSASAWSETAAPPPAANASAGYTISGPGFLAGALDGGYNDANVTAAPAVTTAETLEECAQAAAEFTAQDIGFFVWVAEGGGGGSANPGCYLKKTFSDSDLGSSVTFSNVTDCAEACINNKLCAASIYDTSTLGCQLASFHLCSLCQLEPTYPCYSLKSFTSTGTVPGAYMFVPWWLWTNGNYPPPDPLPTVPPTSAAFPIVPVVAGVTAGVVVIVAVVAGILVYRATESRRRRARARRRQRQEPVVIKGRAPARAAAAAAASSSAPASSASATFSGWMRRAKPETEAQQGHGLQLTSIPSPSQYANSASAALSPGNGGQASIWSFGSSNPNAAMDGSGVRRAGS